MKRCKHENADHLKAGDLWKDHPTAYLGVYLAKCEQFRCLDCGAWLSMGESNDDSEAVQMEMRAAEIAADEDEKMGLCEHFGWEGYLAPKFSTDPADAGYANKWHAGYLARCIVTHDDTQGGET